MKSYFFRVKISWIKLALGGAMVFGIPLIYFFSSSDEEKTLTDSQNEFVEQTEQLIADLSEETKVSSNFPSYQLKIIEPDRQLPKLSLRH